MSSNLRQAPGSLRVAGGDLDSSPLGRGAMGLFSYPAVSFRSGMGGPSSSRSMSESASEVSVFDCARSGTGRRRRSWWTNLALGRCSG
jgi:hypothetical protein